MGAQGEANHFDRGLRFRTRLLFVETEGGQVIIDGLAETHGVRGGVVGSPFALEVRRPQSSLVERLLVDFLRVHCDEERLIDIDLDEEGVVRFHTILGELLMALEGATGLPSGP